MALELINTVEIIELMENYVDSIRPEIEIRNKLDISYEIKGQSVYLIEIRPKWNDPIEKLYLPYAKATYNKSSQLWKVYWLRANDKWYPFSPCESVKHLSDFLNIVEEDTHGCFKG